METVVDLELRSEQETQSSNTTSITWGGRKGLPEFLKTLVYIMGHDPF